MNNQIIENTIKFLDRTELKWYEAIALLECKQFLNNLMQDKKEDKPKK
jgi:hypothetical protein